MSKSLDTKEYLDTVVALLREGKTGVPVPVAGTSMRPFLDPGDTVFLDLLREPPKKGDILLYTRPEGIYVLHRVAEVHPDGSLTMLGDAQTALEPLAADSPIHAIVTQVKHRGKLVSPRQLRWKFYETFWLSAVPLRPRLLRIHQLFSKT